MEVNKLFSEVKDHKIVLNIITFNIVVDALCKEGHIEDAEKVVLTMIQQSYNLDLFTDNSLMDRFGLQCRIHGQS